MSNVNARPVLRSTREAMTILGIGRTTLYELIKKGDLPSGKIGGKTVFCAEDLDALVARARERSIGRLNTSPTRRQLDPIDIDGLEV